MFESQFPRVQHLSNKCSGVLSAVNFVAENRMTKMLEMHSDLVRASAVQLAFQETHFVIRTQNAKFRPRGSALLRRD